ncbi:hypothetical protein AB0F16_10805 [Streptomyces tanashiensis]|uniref:hypothetical protein n=1 Tax=Streptomyces tanashiensis TaxID=67367 RepID=UPI0033C681B8
MQEPMPKGSGRTFPPISDSSCQPLIDARSGEGSFDHVFQIFNWKKNIIPGPEQPQDRNEQFIVVRTGSATATFSELGFGAGLSFPTELVSRQAERLRIAQRS